MSTDTDNEEVNVLGLSDEEVMQLADPEDVQPETDEDLGDENPQGSLDDEGGDTDTDESDEQEDGDEDLDDEDDSDEESEDQDTDSDEDDTDEEPEEDTEQPDTENQDNDADNTKETDDNDSEEPEKAKKEAVDNSIDYEAEYKKIFAPFTANNRQVQIKNAEQAIQLMQMGAGYNEKMRSLKPSFRILKMLDNNKLLDEAKINYLIDLSNKDKGAINKLIKESGIDPLEVDVEKDTDYTPKSHNVDDKQVELDHVLDEIQNTESFKTTVEIIGNTWDVESRNFLSNNPSHIRALNDQIASGVFKQIDDVVKEQRMLGNKQLEGVSDVKAYEIVGSYMQQQGMFTESDQTQNTSVEAVPATKKSTNQNPKLKNRKKAASSTSTAPKTKKKPIKNVLAMSDEEFEKESAAII